MIKNYKLILLLMYTLISTHAQSWTKISSNYDSLWTNSVKYFNKGDTIIYFGSTTGTGASAPKRFYISTDGGYQFERELTSLDNIGTNPIYALKMNNMIIGFRNTPNLGSYKYNSINNWELLFKDLTGVCGEINKGKYFIDSYVFNTAAPSSPEGRISGLPTNMRCTYNVANRVLLGGDGVKYFDDGNYATLSVSTFSPSRKGAIFRFFASSNNTIFAIANNGTEYLYKSTDGGINFTEVTTTYTNNNVQKTLQSSFIMGTPNGNIFYLESSSGKSDNVYLSKDGGLTANKIGNGLPTDGALISPTIGKLLVNGNKVWYQICKANNVDFVRTDTTVAGLYLFSDVITSHLENETSESTNLFPNPSNGGISTQTDGVLEIFDLSGNKIFNNKVLADQEIDLSSLKPGMYFYKINNSRSKKLVIE